MTPENIEELTSLAAYLRGLARQTEDIAIALRAQADRAEAIAHEESVTLAWEKGQLL